MVKKQWVTEGDQKQLSDKIMKIDSTRMEKNAMARRVVEARKVSRRGRPGLTLKEKMELLIVV